MMFTAENGKEEVSGEGVFAKTPSPSPSPKTPIWLAATPMLTWGRIAMRLYGFGSGRPPCPSIAPDGDPGSSFWWGGHLARHYRPGWKRPTAGNQNRPAGTPVATNVKIPLHPSLEKRKGRERIVYAFT